MDTIIQWVEECILITQSLIQKIQEERPLLIMWKTEEMLHNNQAKEDLINDILERRKKIETGLQQVFGSLENAVIQTKATVEEYADFIDARDRWKKSWDELRSLCIDNKFFIQHSLDNMNLCADHLKRLVSDYKTYTAKGTSATNPQAGKVVEGSY